MKIAAFTSGRDDPASRFRVRQYIEPFAARGHVVVEHCPWISKYAGPSFRVPRTRVEAFAQRTVFAGASVLKIASRIPGVVASRGADAVWLQRELLGHRFTLERYLKKPLVFDVDDAIWVGSDRARRTAERIARLADVVIAGNSYLADWFANFNSDVRIVPTGVDTERFLPAHDAPPSRPFRMAWTGSASTLPYLYGIETPLAGFLRDHDAEIVIVADRPPSMPSVPPDRIAYVPWSPENEAAVLRSVHAGLMPLPDDEWTRGKCSFKMIQYMATGLPSVVSPVGMNRDILARGEVALAAHDDAEWRDALEQLSASEARRNTMGQAARRLAVSTFSRDAIAQTLIHVFESVI